MVEAPNLEQIGPIFFLLLFYENGPHFLILFVEKIQHELYHIQEMTQAVDHHQSSSITTMKEYYAFPQAISLVLCNQVLRDNSYWMEAIHLML